MSGGAASSAAAISDKDRTTFMRALGSFIKDTKVEEAWKGKRKPRADLWDEWARIQLTCPADSIPLFSRKDKGKPADPDNVNVCYKEI